MTCARPSLRRRDLLGSAGAWALVPSAAGAAAGAAGMAFEVWRKGAHIGRHAVTVRGDPGADAVADILAEFTVRIGPIPVFHYRHQATETWVAGRLTTFQSRTISNGKVETVALLRDGGALTIRTGARTVVAPPNAAPLTHWRRASLRQPLFNPQTGALIKDSVARRENDAVAGADGRPIPATRYTLTGDAEIVDWYDAADRWCGLRGKAQDGSWVEYLRT